MEKLNVFEVVKPQGIKGELKVRILADGFNNVCKLKIIYDNLGKEYGVKNIKDATNGFAFLSLNGVVSRNDAELLRGKIFSADKNLILKDKNDYFISDLIGLNVYMDDEFFGEIIDVLTANVDIFKIQVNDGKIAYIPFLKALLNKVDLQENKILLKKEKIEEVIYYEGWYINVISRNVHAT